MKFKSIRKKLISSVSTILILSFAGVLSVVAYINIADTQKNLAKSEDVILKGLIAKGRTLVANNSQALKGMVEDNAFTSVKDLVSSTVRDDEDIAYGIFMDSNLKPWVSATPDNPEGNVNGAEVLADETSLWVSALTKADYKLLSFNEGEVYEFAAPVVVEDDEILGHIRYGITTDRMRESLTLEAVQAKHDLIQALVILLGLGCLAIGIGFVGTRRMANRITNPLGTLTGAAGAIASGDYSSEVNVKSNDEIGVLAHNFDSMRRTIQKKMKDLSQLNSTGEVLAVLLDQTKALEEALQTMYEHCKVKQGSIYLLNENDKLEAKAYHPLGITSLDAMPAIFNLGEGIIGRATTEQKIIFVRNTNQDEHYVNRVEGNSGKALLCVPLMDKDTLIGVMNFSGEVDEVVFEDSDYEFTTAIARLLVITIKNIRMREVIEEQNRTLEQKVEERTKALQEKTIDILSMMQNMHQGLLTVLPDCTIHHEYAAFLEEIFETDNIAGRNFMDLVFSNTSLGADQLNQVESAIFAVTGCGQMMYDCNAHMLVTEFTRTFDDGRKKIIELDWSPIVLDGWVDKIMVTVRDVTQLKALQAEADEHKRELEIIGQILSLTPAKFTEFLSTTYSFIEECRRVIQQTDYKSEDMVALLFRIMHTIKGNARTHGFSYITDSVHRAESAYDELRKNPEMQWNQQQLLNDLEQVKRDIDCYQQIAEGKLARITEGASSAVNVDQEAVRQVLESYRDINADGLPENIKNCLAQSLRTLASLEAMPLDKALASVIASVESLSEQLGKPSSIIEINADNVFLRTSALVTLNNIFTHLLRNAIDHGIEPAEERLRSGKLAHGRIDIDGSYEGDYLVLSIADDGRGLPLNKLLKKALETGHFDENDQPTEEQLAQLIFRSGVSTAEQVTDISGRGVGMDAVKQFVTQFGGNIEVVLKQRSDQGNEFRPFEIRIYLPKEMYFNYPAMWAGSLKN